MTDCGFCQGGPVGNANRWSGDTTGPAILPCPRCGKTWTKPTHTHTVDVIDEGWGEDYFGERVPLRLHEIVCVFDGDPGSDDGIWSAHEWVERGAGTLKCPLCADEIPEAPL